MVTGYVLKDNVTGLDKALDLITIFALADPPDKGTEKIEGSAVIE